MSWDVHNLFVRHAREITAALRRRGLSQETAADLTQDAFVRVLVSPPGDAAIIHNPAAYLFRVARNLGIDHQRRERILTRVDMSAEDFAAIADPSPSPEVSACDRQKLALTKAALAELPTRTRKAFEMHRIDEMTIAEVAAELGLSTSRTWQLLRDAYEHIDARLTNY